MNSMCKIILYSENQTIDPDYINPLTKKGSKMSHNNYGIPLVF